MNETKLKMNPDKTEFIHFGSRVQLNKCISDHLYVSGDVIDRTTSIRYLGGYFDSEMNLKGHIRSKCAGAMASYNKIKKIRQYLSPDACTTLVLGLVMSHLDYANSILAGVPDTTLRPFQRLQNMCAKLVLNRSKFESSTEALKQLHWLPIRARIEFKILTVMFQVVHGNAPAYLKDLVQLRSIPRQLRSNHTEPIEFAVPRNRKKTFGDRSIQVTGPRAWNQLPNELRTTNQYETFKAKCKTLLFNKYLNV